MHHFDTVGALRKELSRTTYRSLSKHHINDMSNCGLEVDQNYSQLETWLTVAVTVGE